MTAEELFQRLEHVKSGGGGCRYTLAKCEELVPLVNVINELKRERNAVILAHSYVAPEIIYAVADFTGDSYKLSKDAAGTDAKIIVFSAVRFMGETAKILNPSKEVLIPGEESGCSLADSINADEVRELRRRHPDHTFVCYINTTAEVKAECDVCVTSSNVYRIVESLPTDKIFFLPDRLMGLNLKAEMQKRGVAKEILFSEGTCYVHEQYDPEMISHMRLRYPGLKVVSHPECDPSVVNRSDFVGSTGEMLRYVKSSKDDTFLMLTECGLSGRLEVEVPEKRFVGSCTMCRFMKSNSLAGILRVLMKPRPEDRVEIPVEVMTKAERCIQAMFRYAEPAGAGPGG